MKKLLTGAALLFGMNGFAQNSAQPKQPEVGFGNGLQSRVHYSAVVDHPRTSEDEKAFHSLGTGAFGPSHGGSIGIKIMHSKPIIGKNEIEQACEEQILEDTTMTDAQKEEAQIALNAEYEQRKKKEIADKPRDPRKPRDYWGWEVLLGHGQDPRLPSIDYMTWGGVMWSAGLQVPLATGKNVALSLNPEMQVGLLGKMSEGHLHGWAEKPQKSPGFLNLSQGFWGNAITLGVGTTLCADLNVGKDRKLGMFVGGNLNFGAVNQPHLNTGLTLTIKQ